MIGLTVRDSSIYTKKSERENYSDQVYLSLKFERTFNYRDQVVLISALRQKLKASTIDPIIEQGFIRTDLRPNVTLTAGKKTEVFGSGFLIILQILNENRDIFDPSISARGAPLRG